jgi:hypothetical protein
VRLLLWMSPLAPICAGPSLLSLPSPQYGQQGAFAVSLWIKAAAAAAATAATPHLQHNPPSTATTSGSSSSSSSAVQDPDLDPDLHWLPLLTQAAGATAAAEGPDPALSTASQNDHGEFSRDASGASSELRTAGGALHVCGSRLAVAVGAPGSSVQGQVRVAVKVRGALLDGLAVHAILFVLI